MSWIEQTEQVTISQVQKWSEGQLEPIELRDWAMQHYNTIDFSREFEEYRLNKRLRNLHTIIYWYLASLDCRFIERDHAPKIVEGLKKCVNYFPLEFDGFDHTDYDNARKRAKRLMGNSFYKKYAQLILNPDIQKACEDEVFLKKAFMKLFKYQSPSNDDFDDYCNKTYGSRIHYSKDMHLQKQFIKGKDFIFKGFNQAIFVDGEKKYTPIYVPFEFSFNIATSQCFMSIGQVKSLTDQNKEEFDQSINEPCPNKFAMKYPRFKKFLEEMHYTYLTKPKLKNNKYQEGFFGYWS